jgi:hypothetical protein
MTEEIITHEEEFETPARNWKGDESLGWGVALILAGSFYLLDNFGILNVAFNNWWAIFILAPGINQFANAFRYYQQDGGVTRRVQRAGFGAVVIITLALIFFLNLNNDLLFPIFIIAFGISLLLGNRK